MRRAVVLLALACLAARAPPVGGAGGASPLDATSARRVLGIEGVASAEEVRAAFHRASLAAHPDKQGGSHERFVLVSEAYEVLRGGVRDVVRDGDPPRSGHSSWDASRGWTFRPTPRASWYPTHDDPASTNRDEPRRMPWEEDPWETRNDRARQDANADARWNDHDPRRDPGGGTPSSRRSGGYPRQWSDDEERAFFDDDTSVPRDDRRGGDERKWWDASRSARRAPHFEADRDATFADERAFEYDARARDRDASDASDASFGGGAFRRRAWWAPPRRGEEGLGRDSDRAPGRRVRTRRRRAADPASRGASVGSRRAHWAESRDDAESMEEYVARRAWADAMGVDGHDRRLGDGGVDRNRRDDDARGGGGGEEEAWGEGDAWAERDPGEDESGAGRGGRLGASGTEHLCAAGAWDYC
jgi:hypothetical protein